MPTTKLITTITRGDAAKTTINTKAMTTRNTANNTGEMIFHTSKNNNRGGGATAPKRFPAEKEGTNRHDVQHLK